MKCQQCEKPATFHITELTGPSPIEHHLCEVCAKSYLAENDSSSPPAPTLAGVLAKQLKLGHAAEELARLDQRACPVCGISFHEFRTKGRLGCPHDYTFFHRELKPLIMNIHGETKHVGKRARRSEVTADQESDIIRLRREMKEATQKEEYELAAKLRDDIRKLEQRKRPPPETKKPDDPKGPEAK
jgi:protein arginine kinase activator